jgi:hypothetical protein
LGGRWCRGEGTKKGGLEAPVHPPNIWKRRNPGARRRKKDGLTVYFQDTSSGNVIGGASREVPVFSTKAVPKPNWLELRQPLRPASRPFIHAQVDEALGFGTPCWAAWTPGQLVIDRFARILASFLRALPQPARTPPGKRRLKSASLRCLEIAVSHADCLPCRPVPLAELAGPSPCLLLKMSLCLLRWYLSVPKACAVHAADPRMCEVALPHKVIEIRSVQSMYYCLDTSSENVIGGASPRSSGLFYEGRASTKLVGSLWFRTGTL